MGVTDFIKTRLLNNRVEQYNTKRSYWGENERQPRTDGINTGLDLQDALPPVINKTIANARYAVKLDGYTSGVLKNRIDKANVNIVLVDKETLAEADVELGILGVGNVEILELSLIMPLGTRSVADGIEQGAGGLDA